MKNIIIAVAVMAVSVQARDNFYFNFGGIAFGWGDGFVNVSVGGVPAVSYPAPIAPVVYAPQIVTPVFPAYYYAPYPVYMPVWSPPYIGGYGYCAPNHGHHWHDGRRTLYSDTRVQEVHMVKNVEQATVRAQSVTPQSANVVRATPVVQQTRTITTVHNITPVVRPQVVQQVSSQCVPSGAVTTPVNVKPRATMIPRRTSVPTIVTTNSPVPIRSDTVPTRTVRPAIVSSNQSRNVSQPTTRVKR